MLIVRKYVDFQAWDCSVFRVNIPLKCGPTSNFPDDQFIPPDGVPIGPWLHQHLKLSFFILADAGGCIVGSRCGFNLPFPDD